MERPEIYTDNYNSLEEWIELRKRNEEFVYPQFFVPFREWMKDIEQKSDMEIKELLRILLQPYTLLKKCRSERLKICFLIWKLV